MKNLVTLRPALLCVALLSAFNAPAAFAWNTLDGAAPIVIGHRGASGYLPEHTLASYALAIEQGAHFIEPDLVLTKDGHLIARHEPILDGTTNVSSVFDVSRKSTRLLDGVSTTAYFADTFTLAEIKTLRAIQPRADRDQSFNGLYEIPTLDEVITLAQSKGVGIYPELKHSVYMNAQAANNGFAAHYFEDKLVSTLHAAYGNTSAAPVFIQSFEVSNLQYLNGKTDIRLVQLMDAWDVNADGSMDLTVPPYDRPFDFAEAGDPRTFGDLLTAAGLDFIAGYADGIGPWKPYLLKTVADGVERTGDGVIDARDRLVEGSTGIVEAAHERGLLVHTWTFRDDSIGYQLGYGTPEEEYAAFYALGVDGVFSDHPDTALAALAAVPEPETWAMLLAGLGLIGAAARRRA
ncbi:glycerophosphodiester phosphodiesterase [Methyloversatilis sp. XJ19-49]|uniref:glycerophosphodiester phosphodiesterase n=1 Tax=Methyloversatilis sp. XJ19-49 TaxID=2963429 RepID=UPI00211CE50C|nr:glycerophosphodiester phosphodiesterase family protein [Methyloversatilis sp. XJ19-49]MCQ9378380.1 PEPxxWA-CTERM sorting domain-containing protein [Methyloversatilis sp. XJ19-49]